MAKYRIVKVARYESVYSIQVKRWFIWWDIGRALCLKDAESDIEWFKNRDKAIRDNPRDIVVKTY